MKRYIKLSEWAERHSYTYRGAWGKFKRGQIDGAIETPSGNLLIEDNTEDLSCQPKKEYIVVYARVSSSENKENLDSQAMRVAQFCNANGWKVHEIVKECASGLNDTRPKLTKIFKERNATKLVVEHKDRLTRFGFNYIKELFPECEIVVINEVADSRDDLMQDFVSLVTSFCARLYGNRRTKRSTEKLIKELESLPE